MLVHQKYSSLTLPGMLLYHMMRIVKKKLLQDSADTSGARWILLLLNVFVLCLVSDADIS